MNSPIIILGMHRSGTSMITRLLHLCGLYLGQEKDMMKPQPENPEGYWENWKITRFNDEMLEKMGGNYHQPPHLAPGWLNDELFAGMKHRAKGLFTEFETQPLWGWKDPRSMLLLDLWNEMFPDARYILCIRNPAETAESLAKRKLHGIDFSAGLKLWQDYHENMLRVLKPEQLVITHYMSYFYNPDAELRRVLDLLKVEASETQIKAAVQTVRRDLIHNMSAPHLAEHVLTEPVYQHYMAFAAQSGPVYEQMLQDDGYQVYILKNGLYNLHIELTQQRHYHQQQMQLAQQHVYQLQESSENQLQVLLQHARLEYERNLQTSIHQLQAQHESEMRTFIDQSRAHHENEMQVLFRQQEIEINRLRQHLQTQHENELQVLLQLTHAQYAGLQAQATQLEQELNAINQTRAWRFVRRWYRVKAKIVPSGSKRERSYHLVRSATGTLVKGGPLAFIKRTYLWAVKGERRYYQQNPVPAALPDEVVVSTPPPVAEVQPVVELPIQQLPENIKVEFDALLDEFGTDNLFILNWNTGLKLAETYEELAVFSPPVITNEPSLPYLSETVDIVVVAGTDQKIWCEALRVARLAVVGIAPFASNSKALVIERKTQQEKETIKLPSVSLIIAVYNHLDYTEQCLEQILATIPSTIDAEIIVVDDCSPEAGIYEGLKAWEQRDSRIKVIRNEQNMSYLMTCNLGASEAKNDIIVMLNNDILPQPGWLKSLVQTFVDYPDAGAVGGKLVYPNGRLQEAGCIIYANGSAWNVGRLGDPDDPYYNFVRKVHYCSAATMATWRWLWDEIGGYDERYRPLYYEDSDYCMEVRNRGYSVYFQPACKIIHFEGVTSGTDPSKADAPKQYQTVNHAKFVEKWHETLKSHPLPMPDASLESMHRVVLSSQTSKRVLFCIPVMPEFDKESGSRRIYHFVKMFQQLGWSVTLLVQNAHTGERYVHLMRQEGVAVFAGMHYFDNPEEVLQAGQFDLVIAVFWHFASHFIDKVRTTLPNARFVVDTIDLHFLRSVRDKFVKGRGASLDMVQGDDFFRELNTYRAANAVFTVSQKEADLINDFMVNQHPAYCIPDSEDLSPSLIPFENRRGILFIGNFRHPPNVQALRYLLDEIVPQLDAKVLEEHPLYIVGNDIQRFLKPEELQQANPNIHIVGWVPSVFPYLELCRISIVPLLVGAGTKRKLLQSLLLQTPAVSTTIGIEGLGVVDGEQVLVADEPHSFAKAITRLLHDEKLWHKLAQNGREHIIKIHSYEATYNRLEQIITTVMGESEAVS